MRVLCFILSALFCMPITAYAAENTQADVQISAEYAIVIDMKSLEVLYEKSAHTPHPMASTTKIMTALLACESGRLEETVTVTDDMLDVIGSSVGLEAGNKITLYDLVVGLMLASGNDAANSAAVYLDGSIDEFVNHMNERANEICMYDTVFGTPSGLDKGDNHSSAYDMAVLTAAALKNNTFSEICSMQKAQINIDSMPITLYNHNKLLSSLKGCIGVKTGYTDKAGRCLVSAAEDNSNTVICVTLNAPDDWNDHKKLIKSCRKKYKQISVSDNITMFSVGGDVDTFSASYSGELFLLDDNIKKEEYYYPFVYAPIKKGETVGYVIINNEYKLPIIADENVEAVIISESNDK